MILPIWLNGERIKPCRSFCHEVERLCPYFLPAEKTGPGSQYAGEPSFSCIGMLRTSNIKMYVVRMIEKVHFLINF